MTASLIAVKDVCVPLFDEERHLYTVNGRNVPSVSALIRPLTECVYGAIDPAILRRAAEFGTAVHLCTQYLDEGDLDRDSIDPEWLPYVSAYEAWKKDADITVDAIELRLGCSRYCGTIDRLCTIKGEPWVVDLKTTTQIHAHVGVQLAAYEALAAAKFGKRYRRAALQLRGDGTYRFREFTGIDDELCFAALLNIHAWEHKHEYRN